jgi:hypothetical protein
MFTLRLPLLIHMQSALCRSEYSAYGMVVNGSVCRFV